MVFACGGDDCAFKPLIHFSVKGNSRLVTEAKSGPLRFTLVIEKPSALRRDRDGRD